MGYKAIRTSGADDYFSNISGNNFATSVQGVPVQARLFTLVMQVPSGITGARTVWIYDLAAGATTSKAPVLSLHVAAGATGVLDMDAGGFPFKNGIYCVIATNDPPDANTAPTVATANDAQITASYRLYP